MPMSTRKGGTTTDEQTRLGHLVEQFRILAAQHPGPVSDSLHISGPASSPHVVVGLMVHGNEHGTLPEALTWAKEMIRASAQGERGARLTLFLGNVAAGMAGRRFLEADLNRQFSDQAPPSAERNRAQELLPLLRQCDIFIDLHQTIEETDRPFFIFGFHPPSVALAGALAPGVASTLVTRKQGSPFAQGLMCGDEFVRSLGKAAVTLEVSRKGFSPEADRTTAAVLSNLEKMMSTGWLQIFRADRGCAPDPAQATSTAQTLQRDASGGNTSATLTDLDCFFITRRLPFSEPGCKLKAGLRNFSPIVSGQELGTDPDGQILRSDVSGYALFPKYPERDSAGRAQPPLPQDLLCIAEAIGPASALEKFWK